MWNNSVIYHLIPVLGLAAFFVSCQSHVGPGEISVSPQFILKIDGVEMARDSGIQQYDWNNHIVHMDGAIINDLYKKSIERISRGEVKFEVRTNNNIIYSGMVTSFLLSSIPNDGAVIYIDQYIKENKLKIEIHQSPHSAPIDDVRFCKVIYRALQADGILAEE